MIEGNAKRSITWTKRHADNRDLKRCGHQLVSFQPEPGTWAPEGWAGNAVYTCTQCWRFGPYSTFRCECKPYRWPKSFFDLPEKIKELLSEKWQTTVATATDFFTKNAGPAIKNKLQNKNKEFSDAKFDRLIEEGIEPHPRPNIRPRQAVHFNIVTINVAGVPGAWRALDLKHGRTVS